MAPPKVRKCLKCKRQKKMCVPDRKCPNRCKNCQKGEGEECVFPGDTNHLPMASHALSLGEDAEDNAAGLAVSGREVAFWATAGFDVGRRRSSRRQRERRSHPSYAEEEDSNGDVEMSSPVRNEDASVDTQSRTGAYSPESENKEAESLLGPLGGGEDGDEDEDQQVMQETRSLRPVYGVCRSKRVCNKCKRDKTKCEVQPGAVDCVRCTTMKKRQACLWNEADTEEEEKKKLRKRKMQRRPAASTTTGTQQATAKDKDDKDDEDSRASYAAAHDTTVQTQTIELSAPLQNQTVRTLPSGTQHPAAAPAPPAAFASETSLGRLTRPASVAEPLSNRPRQADRTQPPTDRPWSCDGWSSRKECLFREKNCAATPCDRCAAQKTRCSHRAVFDPNKPAGAQNSHALLASYDCWTPNATPQPYIAPPEFPGYPIPQDPGPYFTRRGPDAHHDIWTQLNGVPIYPLNHTAIPVPPFPNGALPLRARFVELGNGHLWATGPADPNSPNWRFLMEDWRRAHDWREEEGRG